MGGGARPGWGERCNRLRVGNGFSCISDGPPPCRNVRKVFIRFGLGLDLRFWVDGKVLILLGFNVADDGKVFISNR